MSRFREAPQRPATKSRRRMLAKTVRRAGNGSLLLSSSSLFQSAILSWFAVQAFKQFEEQAWQFSPREPDSSHT
jgi:hypothetical protein